MRLGFLAVPVLLASCATSDDRINATNQQLDAYMRCNRDASKAVSTQPGDPVSLAVAARSMCPKEDLALHDAIYSNYDLSNAERVFQSYRRDVLESNVGDIVKFRVRR